MHEQGLLNSTDVEINLKEKTEKEKWESHAAAEEEEWNTLEILKHPSNFLKYPVFFYTSVLFTLFVYMYL